MGGFNLNVHFQPVQPEWARKLSFLTLRNCTSELAASISYAYEFKYVSPYENEILLPGIPDGCIDLIFNLKDGNELDCLLVPSPKIRQSFAFKSNTLYFGVRLLPLQTAFDFKLTAPEINKHMHLPLFDALPSLRTLYKQLMYASSIDERLQLVERSIEQTQQINHSNIMMYCMQTVINKKGNIHLKELEQLTGYSDRYLRKLFHEEIGMSPKLFFETIYFQFTVQEMQNGHFNLDEHIATNGLYDISHFYKKFKKFTDMTPEAYKRLIT